MGSKLWVGTSSGVSTWRPLNMALKRDGAGAFLSVVAVVVYFEPPTFRVTCSDAFAVNCRQHNRICAAIRSFPVGIGHQQAVSPDQQRSQPAMHRSCKPPAEWQKGGSGCGQLICIEQHLNLEAVESKSWTDLGNPKLLFLKLLPGPFQLFSLLPQGLALLDDIGEHAIEIAFECDETFVEVVD